MEIDKIEQLAKKAEELKRKIKFIDGILSLPSSDIGLYQEGYGYHGLKLKINNRDMDTLISIARTFLVQQRLDLQAELDQITCET
jgi:hypothetical protein